MSSIQDYVVRTQCGNTMHREYYLKTGAEHRFCPSCGKTFHRNGNIFEEGNDEDDTKK